MDISPAHSSSHQDVESNFSPSHNIITPPSTPVHVPIKSTELYPLAQGLKLSYSTLASITPSSLRLESSKTSHTLNIPHATPSPDLILALSHPSRVQKTAGEF